MPLDTHFNALALPIQDRLGYGGDGGFVVKKRESRRDLTHRAAARAQREHLKVVHPDGKPDCVCERSVLYFAKRKSITCRCRGRKHGQPKFGTGICHGYRRPAVSQRIAWRAEQHRWLHGRGDATDRFDRGLHEEGLEPSRPFRA